MARIEEPCCRPLRQSDTTEKKPNDLKYSYDQLHCNEKIHILYMTFQRLNGSLLILFHWFLLPGCGISLFFFAKVARACIWEFFHKMRGSECEDTKLEAVFERIGSIDAPVPMFRTYSNGSTILSFLSLSSLVMFCAASGLSCQNIKKEFRNLNLQRRGTFLTYFPIS